jgi:hypothetical protein
MARQVHTKVTFLNGLTRRLACWNSVAWALSRISWEAEGFFASSLMLANLCLAGYHTERRIGDRMGIRLFDIGTFNLLRLGTGQGRRS